MHPTADQVTGVADLLRQLRERPGETAVLCDIDGTLAPIVEDPDAASVPEEARRVLEEATERYLLVACVSGRRALDARKIVGVDGITYAGNHGFEVLAPGADTAAPDPAIGERSGAAAAFLDEAGGAKLAEAGLYLEDKGSIQALHWRRSPDPDGARARAEGIAEAALEAGLVPRWGRKVLELRPVSGIDKGSATSALVRGAGARLALFGGDDATDLDAFGALRWLVRSGELEAAVCIGVGSEEEPPGLREQADAVVGGTAGFLEVLRLLVGASD